MELIGEGGNWEIFFIENTNKVFRIPKFSSMSFIENFKKNHRIIKNLGLPTLDIVEIHVINDVMGLICENVNYLEEKIFVSHNSLYSDSNKMVDLLSEKLVDITNRRKSSLAEDFRYCNKIEEISNFEEFYLKVKLDLELAAINGFLIEYDSYFFGTFKHKSLSTIEYKLLDLDNIIEYADENKENLYEMNLEEFLRAISGFLKYFLKEEKLCKYLKFIT